MNHMRAGNHAQGLKDKPSALLALATLWLLSCGAVQADFSALMADSLNSTSPPTPPTGARPNSSNAVEDRSEPASGYGIKRQKDARHWTLTAEDWARPRTASYLIRHPDLLALIRAWSPQQPTPNILIRYHDSDEGLIWASELADWIVALGVPSRFLITQSGVTNPDTLMLSLETPR